MRHIVQSIKQRLKIWNHGCIPYADTPNAMSSQLFYRDVILLLEPDGLPEHLGGITVRLPAQLGLHLQRTRRVFLGHDHLDELDDLRLRKGRVIEQVRELLLIADLVRLDRLALLAAKSL